METAPEAGGGPRGKGRPKLTETAEIDRTIRAAALRVLLEQGAAATMNAVALAAGLSRKTVYARYSNKGELFLDVIRELLGGVKELEYDSRGSAEEQLLHYVLAALDVISQPQSLAIQRLLAIDPAYISALKTEMTNATTTIFFAPLVRMLDQAKSKGEFEIDDVSATAKATIRLVLAEGASIGRDPTTASSSHRQDYAAFVVRLLCHGFLPRSSNADPRR